MICGRYWVRILYVHKRQSTSQVNQRQNTVVIHILLRHIKYNLVKDFIIAERLQISSLKEILRHFFHSEADVTDL
jgi:hypothetical protein